MNKWLKGIIAALGTVILIEIIILGVLIVKKNGDSQQRAGLPVSVERVKSENESTEDGKAESEETTEGISIEDSMESESPEDGSMETDDDAEDTMTETETETDYDIPDIMFIGDSRTVGMQVSVAYPPEEYGANLFSHHIGDEYTSRLGDTVFLAKGGEEFFWFSTIAAPLALRYLEESKTEAIVMWFGVNDLQDWEYYTSYVNNVMLEWGPKIYYLTLGPCSESNPERKAEIQAFNAKLFQLLDPKVQIIDIWRLIQDGIEAGDYHLIDALHYDYATSRGVYDFVINYIRSDLGQ